MKKLLFIIFLFGSNFLFPQSSPCKTNQVLNTLLINNPQIQQTINSVNSDIYKLQTESEYLRSTSLVPPAESITIPVVFYIVHDGTPSTNIADSQIQQQLQALNLKFYNTGMKFCLATKAGTGTSIPTSNLSSSIVNQSTPGIIHILNLSLTNHTTTVANQTALLNTAHSSITGDKYLRIWVVKSIDTALPTTLGYAWFPNGSSFFDGIVLRSNVCGNGNPNLLANYNQGETLVHEVGHYLGLYHTFQGGCSTVNNNPLLDGDLVSDTPSVAAPNYYCSPGTNSCVENPAVNDLIQNYMDYGNNVCSDSFTNGQIERMINLLNVYRSNLNSNENLIYTGVCGSSSLISATITPNTYTVCQNIPTVNFQAFPASSYSWNFGDPTSTTNSSNLQNPTHTFSSILNSPYTVTLTVTSPTGLIATSSIQIFVTDCNNYTLSSDSYWYTSQSNGLKFVPGNVPFFDTTFPSNNTTPLTSVVQNDINGNVLFYANRDRVYNKNNNLISPSSIGTGQSTSSSMIIVPNPANTNEYYIFNNSVSSNDGFKKSLVTISGTNATMSLSTTRQPINFPSGYSASSDGSVWGGNGVTAIKKCDGYWVITILYKNSNYYLVSYSLTSTGLIWQNEYLLPINLVIDDISNIKASPNGNKIFIYSHVQSIIVDFNKVIGSFSDHVDITNGVGASGASFSPDSKLLYTNVSYDSNDLYQYNLNTSNIIGSKISVGYTDKRIGTMQLGPDNKLYLGNYYGKELGIIHNPNLLSNSLNINACNFSTHGPKKTFGSDINFFGGLPNMIDAKQETAYFAANNPNVISDYPTTLCNTFKFFPNICGSSFNWTFTNTSTGITHTSTNTNPVYTFTTSGLYTITLRNSTNTVVLGTMNKNIVVDAPVAIITGSTTACLTEINSTNHSTSLLAGETASWSVTGGYIIGGGNTSNNINVNWTSLPGQVTLTVTNANGCSASSTTTIANVCCDCLNKGIWQSVDDLYSPYDGYCINRNECLYDVTYNFQYVWSFTNDTTITTNTPCISEYQNGQILVNNGVKVKILDAPNGNVVCSRTFGNVIINGRTENKPLKSSNSIQIYPIPSKNEINIKIENFKGTLSCIILDMNGRLVYNEDNFDFQEEKNININNISSGIYIIKLFNKDFEFNDKIIKN